MCKGIWKYSHMNSILISFFSIFSIALDYDDCASVSVVLSTILYMYRYVYVSTVLLYSLFLSLFRFFARASATYSYLYIFHSVGLAHIPLMLGYFNRKRNALTIIFLACERNIIWWKSEIADWADWLAVRTVELAPRRSWSTYSDR